MVGVGCEFNIEVGCEPPRTFVPDKEEPKPSVTEGPEPGAGVNTG